jgi:cephalosporin hydroxylase
MTSYFESTPDAHPDYCLEKKERIQAFSSDMNFKEASKSWRIEALEKKYMNNFSWLGRPLIQLPADVMAIQEIIWAVKPDLIIETGVAHGGSLVLSASILQLIGKGEVLGIDVEIRPHNRAAIENHPLAHRISLLEGSSTAPAIIEKVKTVAHRKQVVLVFLDSNHTHEHVFLELEAYANLVTPGSYCVVFDTFVEDMPEDYVWTDRPWGKGNNPKTAVDEWLQSHPEFEVDLSIENRLLLTSAPGGFLYKKFN